MKAQNLTISIPSPKGCNKKCPYCVSNMTGHIKHNWNLMMRNMSTVVTLAKSAQVNNVLLTSKGEPLMHMNYTMEIAEWFREFPLEIQTNGRLLLEGLEKYESGNIYQHENYKRLYQAGVNVIAISIDHEKEFDMLREAIIKCVELGLVVRLSINCNKFLGEYLDINKIFNYAWETGAKQIIFRRLSIPEGSSNGWIELNTVSEYDFIEGQLNDIIDDAKLMRYLITGEGLYEYEGISFTHSDHCIQERSNGENDIRSLIFLEDGHVYTSWNSKAPLF